MSIEKAISISVPSFDGHRVVRAALKYDAAPAANLLSADAFAVEGRTVTGVYAASQPEADAPDGGTGWVILTLDPQDEEAHTVKSLRKHREGPPAPPPPGTVFKGPHGLAKKREPVRLAIRQVKALGDAAPCEIVSDEERNALSDLFEVRVLEGKEYNLFIPRDYDPEKTYPMVLFIGDASIAGKDARITLEQGTGAIQWVRPAFQKKHPCFVLAPAHYDEEPITNDLYEATDQLDRVKRMCEAVMQEYNIGHVVTTGQSMGCMSSYELMHRWPGFFAAGLCVSGHWDRQKIAELAWRGQKVWTIMSELDDKGDVCIEEVREILKARGVDYGWRVWDGRKSPEDLCADVAEALTEDHTFRVSIYEGESALRKGMPDEAPGGHPSGWYLTYRIEAILDWLITQ